MILTIAFSLWIQEFYPFSWFPMFTNLEKNTWYIFLTDGAGKKIPIEDEFGWTGDHTDNFFKAHYKRSRKLDPNLSPEDALVGASQETLRRLLNDPKWRVAHPDPSETRAVWRTDVRLVDGRLVLEDRELGRSTAAQAATKRNQNDSDDDTDANDDDGESR